MNQIFEYNLPYKTKEEVVKVQDNGDKVISTEEVEKTVKVIIKEPTRQDIEKSKNIYQESWSDCVRRGILTRAIIDKNYRGQNGILTDDELKSLGQIQDRLGEIQGEYKELNDKENKTDKDQAKLTELINEFAVVQEQISALENVNESLYKNTAESIAFERQILWNIVSLSYIERNGKVVPLADGDTLDEKLDYLDKITQNKASDDAKLWAEIYTKAIDRNGYFINMLSRGKITDSQLKDINDAIDKGDLAI